MKIGLVLPAVPAYSETFFVNKIKGLQAYGHEVILFVHTKTSLISFEGAPIRSAPSWSKNPLKRITQFLILVAFHSKIMLQFYLLERRDGAPFFLILKRILINSHLLSEKLDWLHFGFGTMVIERENIAQAIGARMAVSFRGYDHYVYPIKNKNCYSLLFSKDVKYHVLSDGMRQSLLHNGIASSHVVKITPAIDLNLFSVRELNTENTVPQLLTLARLHWIKGLESTLQALALLKEKGVKFHYTIVGDGPEKERLQFTVYQLGLSNYVTFKGKLAHEKIRKELQKIDIYLQYSFQEGFCNAVLEAQAMGKICVVSDAEGLIENVLDEVTGFVVPKRNPLSLMDTIERIFHLSANKKEQITNQAVNRVKEKFSIEKQIHEFIQFYQ